MNNSLNISPSQNEVPDQSEHVPLMADSSNHKKRNKQLSIRLKNKRLPSLKQIKQLPRLLTSKESWGLHILSALILMSVIFLGTRFYLDRTIIVPDQGGSYTEALIGVPQKINPLLSQLNDVDLDIERLIFSRLLKVDSRQKLVPDLATYYDISEDEKTYTFRIRDDVYWHDGEMLTADDIIFTVKRIQEKAFKGPLQISFRGVAAKKIDDHTVRFVLQEPYAGFLEILTFGVLPKHLWQSVEPQNTHLAELNLKPIGSGPFKFKSFTKDKDGNIKSYLIERNDDYYGKNPFLDNITFTFHDDFEMAVNSLKKKDAQGISFLPKNLKDGLKDVSSVDYKLLRLPQYTAIFFNQSQNEALKDKNIRKALTLALDKDRIVQNVLKGEGEVIHGPILPGLVGYNPNIEVVENSIEEAQKLIKKAGWKTLTQEEYLERVAKEKEEAEAEAQKAKEKEEEEEKTKAEAASNNSDNNKAETSPERTDEGSDSKEPADSPPKEDQSGGPATISPEADLGGEELLPYYLVKKDEILTIRLTTVDSSETKQAAEIIKAAWQAVGVKVDLEIIEGAEIQAEVIKPRNYESFLYGVLVGSDSDPYPFWHSSQNEDPGVNLAIFKNNEVDELLEDARKTTDKKVRGQKYQHFQNILVKEIPAIFLYNPTYTYVLDKDIKGFAVERIAMPADRFANILDWHKKTKRNFVWNKGQ